MTTTSEISGFHSGPRAVDKLYVGANEAWTNGPPPRVTPIVQERTRWITQAYGFDGVQAGDLLIYMAAGTDPGYPVLNGGQVSTDWNVNQNAAASQEGAANSPPWYDMPAPTLASWNNWVAWKIADGTETAATQTVYRSGYTFFGSNPNWVHGWRITGYDPTLEPISLGNDVVNGSGSKVLASKPADEQLENGLMLYGVGSYRSFGSPTMDLTLDVDYGEETSAVDNGGTSRYGEYYLPADGSVPAISITIGSQTYRARRLFIPGARS